MPIRDRILSIFEAPCRAPLLEFAKAVAASDSDYTICMARKAARLLDLLALAGVPTNPRPVIFHHVLEQDLARFRNKSITLVDDTLILGTTLGAAERQLRNAGAANVASIVLAVDKEQWDRSLVVPRRNFLSLTHQELLTFCSAEVHALNAFSIPYLTDFPITRDMRLTRQRLERMQSLERWETVPIHSVTQAAEGSLTYSAISGASTLRALERSFGPEVATLVNLAKVRIFSRHVVGGGYWTRLVPIATLAPLRSASVESLFETIVAGVEHARGRTLKTLRASIREPTAKLRFAQYMLSAVVGREYFLQLRDKLDLQRDPGFSIDEAVRLFGSWLRRDVTDCHSAVEMVVDGIADRPAVSRRPRSSDLPSEIVRISQSECERFVARPSEIGGAISATRTAQTDLERIFVRLHQHYEPAARAEVKKYGSGIYDLPPEKAPHRDRLKFGFDWRALAGCVLEREGLKPTPQRRARLSFLLDSLIDTGVAVPLLTERDGVHFRAYRYGEDVPFANQQYALAFDAAAGFLEGAAIDSISRVAFEKLLVSLLKAGVAKRFLVEQHSLRGIPSGVARIGFHLHGAVATMPSDDSLLADHQDSWLSSYLVEEGVLTKDARGRYGLGVRPEAALITREASTESRQLGFLLGHLTRERDDQGHSFLSEQELIVLASCSRPRDVAMALAAELNIILSQFRFLPATAPTTPVAARRQYTSLVNSSPYTALNSARMKFTSYKNGAVHSIVERCAQKLASEANGSFMARHWQGIWEPILAASDANQVARFDPLIDACQLRLQQHAYALFALELTVASVVASSKKRVDRDLFKRACGKARDYLDWAPRELIIPEIRTQLWKAVDKPTFETPIEMYADGKRRSRDIEFESRVLFREITSAAREFGRIDEKINYQYVLWYDIVDSTGQRAELRGDALRNYRNRVRNFKEGIIEGLTDLMFEGQRRNIEIYCWANALRSKDDEKNIFFRGNRSLDLLRQALSLLTSQARSSRVLIRAIAMDTAFAGEPAHKYASDPMVEGEAFWEHGSRLKQQLKKREPASDNRSSYIWLANELAKTPKRIFPQAEWLQHLQHGEVDTTIENYPLSTPFAGGRVRL